MTACVRLIEKGNEVRTIPLREMLTVGKSPEMDLQLNRKNISRQHCRIYHLKNSWTIEDLNSRNGTWVDGYRIETPQTLHEGTTIKLGDYELIFTTKTTSSVERPKVKVTPLEKTKSSIVEIAPIPSTPSKSKPLPKIPIELKRKIHSQLLEDKGLKSISSDDEKYLYNKTKEVIERLVHSIKIPSHIDHKELIKVILDEALGLGPLEDLIADSKITEIMVNNWDTIYVERDGVIFLSDKQFADNSQLIGIIRRILAPIGRRIDESSPMVDARLKDGSRVNAIIPPLALDGPTLTIRKFAKTPFTADDLIRMGTMTKQVAELLKIAVESRQNILISGGTGSGKTTLLNLVSGYIPENERIVTIEDAAELRLVQDHVVRLEARPANIEGEGAIPIRQLVINSLRMRPDRIVVGECRGGEALDMLQAMNTGHDGSLTTLHANSPRDALARLETLVLMSGMELPAISIRQQIASAINLIVQIQRFPDGKRRITNVAEITGMEGDVISMANLFEFKQKRKDQQGNILGDLIANGTIPRFVQKLREANVDVDLNLFRKIQT